LRTLCEKLAHPSKLDERFPYDHSKLARFYRWATEMKEQWNIEEEKLVITLIFAIITTIIIIIMCIFPENSFSFNNDVCQMSKLI
jgi:hypothetical protein